MPEIELDEAVNVFGEPLEPCGLDPLTGFFRDGCCNTSEDDPGSHTVCAVMTTEFLEASRSRGNDLVTPVPEAGFPGLEPGDRWCLCADRWLEAYRDGIAPDIYLAATHRRACDVIPLEILKQYAKDLN